MASKNKIIELIGTIKTVYPYYAKDTNANLLVGTWEALLKRFDDQIVSAAIFKALQTCKVPPTPADVIEAIGDLQSALEPSVEELWEVYCDALKGVAYLIYYFNFTAVEPDGLTQGQKARLKADGIWDGLPEKIQKYCGSKKELIRMAMDYNKSLDFLNYEKNRFLKQMPTVIKRQENSDLLRIAMGGDAIERRAISAKSENS